MKIQTLLVLLLISTSCTEKISEEQKAIQTKKNVVSENSINTNKIQVLNFATFHMGNTSDANSVEFDEKDKKNQQDAKKIAKLIADFKPTIICVEVPWSKNEELQIEYQKYLEDPTQFSTYYGEVGMVAFEVSRLSSLNRIYGIDHKMEYNYLVGQEIENTIDSITYNRFYNNPYQYHPKLNSNLEKLSLFEKLKLFNNQEFLGFLITYNADMLALAGTDNGFEGADEAAKYYKRNLRIYSNLNRIPMTNQDRIFILSGGSHTAFLGEFMERSPKFKLVNVQNYLK